MKPIDLQGHPVRKEHFKKKSSGFLLETGATPDARGKSPALKSFTAEVKGPLKPNVSL